MSLYRMYVDETGNHDLVHADDPNQRFLALTGVILESNYNLNTLQPEMNALKNRFFRHDPDESVIFHRKDMINKRPPFEALRDQKICEQFDQALLDYLGQWAYRVITVVIDKKVHRDQYSVWRYHPYHYCMQIIIERLVLFLEDNDFRGDVMVESRGGREDRKLKDSFERLYRHGTDYISADRCQAKLTSKRLKVKPKSKNIAGLQLADLIAHPSRRQILLEAELIRDDRTIFGDKICRILDKNKYLRSPNGRIAGFGKKLLP